MFSRLCAGFAGWDVCKSVPLAIILYHSGMLYGQDLVSCTFVKCMNECVPLELWPSSIKHVVSRIVGIESGGYKQFYLQ